jgi:broad specificity phosphatase PhoE
MKENTHLTAITRNEAERLLRHVRSGRIRIHWFNPNYLSDLPRPLQTLQGTCCRIGRKAGGKGTRSQEIKALGRRFSRHGTAARALSEVKKKPRKR